MTNLEEKSPIIIKKLLSNDLETRKSGLKLLQEETQNEWIPEYREYLWKTISQEKPYRGYARKPKRAPPQNFSKTIPPTLRKLSEFALNQELALKAASK